jgi:hypothetical protein
MDSNLSLLGILPMAASTADCPGPFTGFLAGAPSFTLHLVKAIAVSDDGMCTMEFDARAWLEAADDEDLILLCEEWFCGDGPGCRRVLERHSRDTQAFLAYTQQHAQAWSLRFDEAAVRRWIDMRRPYLSDHVDPEMIAG